MEEFLPDTVVRIKATGRFGKIISRCFCGSGKAPIHYEILVEYDTEKGHHAMVMDHSNLDIECEPK